MKQPIIFTLVLLLSVTLFHSSAHSKDWPVGSFSATRVEFDKVSRKKEQRSKVYVSKLGIREEGLDDKNHTHMQQTVVVSFEKSQTWILVPRRKIYMQLPTEGEEGVKVEDEPGTVLVLSPCDGYSFSEKRRATTHENRKVEEWHCHDKATGDVTQLYDATLRMVVRSEDKNGRVEELRNISEGEQPDSLFKVPEGYRKASLREIMTGTTELPGYSENGALGEKKK